VENSYYAGGTIHVRLWKTFSDVVPDFFPPPSMESTSQAVSFNVLLFCPYLELEAATFGATRWRLLFIPDSFTMCVSVDMWEVEWRDDDSTIVRGNYLRALLRFPAFNARL